jgi:hypothetical protein
MGMAEPLEDQATTGASGDAFAAAHAEMLTDQSLQFQLEMLVPPEIPEWLEPLLRFLQLIAPLFVYVFWIGVAVIVLLVLYFIISEIIKRMPDRARGAETGSPARPEYKPSAAHARALLEEADRLAAIGRYSEAARVLLHRSIEDLERVFAMAIGPGLTSREIAQLEPLSTQGRGVFTHIAYAVETSLFGGRSLSADDFLHCREGYVAFALAGQAR